MKPKKKGPTFLGRLSGPGLFSLRFFGWSYLILFIPQIALDVIAYETGSWLWLPIWTFGHLLIGVCAFFLRSLWLDKRLTEKPSAALNILVAAGLGAIRVSFIGYSSFQFGLAPEFNLVARIIAGAILGSTLFLILGSVISSRTDYRSTLGELFATQRQLENMRRAKRNEVTELQRELEISTRKVIEPKLEAIARAISRDSIDVSTKNAIAQDLRLLLDSQIKPLNARLKSTNSALANSDTFRGISATRLLRLPDLVKPDLAINPLLQFLVLVGSIPFALYVFEGPERIPLGFGIAALTALLLFLCKIALSKLKSMSPRLALVALLAVIMAQAALGLLILASSGLPDQTTETVGILLFLAVFLTTIFYGLVVAYEYNQQAFMVTLSRNNNRLSRELALLNQRLWIEKRQWALQIHGSVQASLTTALARLAKTGAPTSEQLTKVREDLTHAIKGLKDSGASPVDLRNSLKDIQRTWKGIVKVKIDLKSEFAKQVLADPWGAVIANEIIKEAVSNSFKHGKADTVKVSFEPARQGAIEIVVQDNGLGISSKHSGGLGSQILDEIAFPWSLLNQPTGGSILRAQIAISTKKLRAVRK